jgi:FG-GAP-like repeat/FG-GAP repeat
VFDTSLLCAALLACGGLSGCVFYLNPLCNDQIRNGDETDVDCGGRTCGPCNLGDSCRKDADCDDGICVSGTCTPLPCANGKLDPGETDVDCGGATCGKCAGGRTCASDSDCFSDSCVASSHTCFALANVSFADQVSYLSGNKSYALFAGDLDGDGRVDLVATNELDSTLSVFLGTGTGTFQALVSGPAAYPTGTYPTGGGIFDVNHDGIPDVITADYHGNSVSVLLGTPSGVSPGKGTGALAGVRSFPTRDDAETSNLAVGDLNGDGNLDVVAVNPGVIVPAAASVSQFMGRADGTLEPAITAPIGIAGNASPFSVTIGDFDGNGTKDLAIADNVSVPVIVKLGNGDGTFQAEAGYPSGGLGATFIITYDMNKDGHLDLVCANRNSDNVSVLLGRGDGTFRKAIVTDLGPKPLPLNTPAQIGPYSIAVADFNRDGVPDVVTSDYLTSTATVLLGVGNGHFEAPIDAGAVGKSTYGIAVGDFNGDGKPDFATSNALSNDVTVKLSTSH